MTFEENTTQDTEAETEQPATVAPKADRTRIAYEGNGVTIGGASYSLDAVPDRIRTHLSLVGLAAVVQRSKDPAATYAKMQAGELPGRGGRPAKAKELSPWKLAYAHAKVEQTKKSDNPITLEQAKTAAEALDANALRLIKTNPLVVKHFAKLTGATAELV